jgi:uncharacterized protein
MPTIKTARAWYPSGDAVHGFDHILRVYRLAERIAQAEGADLRVVRAAVLLHDVEGFPPSTDPALTDELSEPRMTHHYSAAQFAAEHLRGEGWNDDDIAAVQHCIRAHRFRDGSEQPKTIEAQVLFDADKLDAIGAIGVARAIAYAAQHGQPAYVTPSEQFQRNGELEPGESHSAYHEYLFKLRKLLSTMYTATGLALAEERHRFMAAYFERLESEIFGEY